ncbi:hypothetical protein GCM10022295_81920 [Streptomyces osmaniensis]|uniref:Uncharacterized protein n=1 Tax=Streptomyces osmaniensis TaxID=593134 RepID=A0ABP6YPF2_9ACTN
MESSNGRVRNAAGTRGGVRDQAPGTRADRTPDSNPTRPDAGRDLAHHHVVAAYLTAVAAVVTAAGTILTLLMR